MTERNIWRRLQYVGSTAALLGGIALVGHSEARGYSHADQSTATATANQPLHPHPNFSPATENVAGFLVGGMGALTLSVLVADALKERREEEQDTTNSPVKTEA